MSLRYPLQVKMTRDDCVILERPMGQNGTSNTREYYREFLKEFNIEKDLFFLKNFAVKKNNSNCNPLKQLHKIRLNPTSTSKNNTSKNS